MAATDSEDSKDGRQDGRRTVSKDVVPGAGMLGPQRGAQVEQQAMGQVEERRRGGQHPLHRPDKLLRLQRRRGGEEADAFPVEHMAAGCRRKQPFGFYSSPLKSRGAEPKQVTQRPF